jgi:hypothetical protein
MKLAKFLALSIAALSMVACGTDKQGDENNDEGNNGFITQEYVKVYCDVTATGWETVGVWAWDLDDTSINYTGGTWPGAALTVVETIDGKANYVWEAPKELIGKTIGFIVNQFVEGGEQTEDIEITVTDGLVITLTEKADSGKWLATGGEIVVPEEKPEPVMVLGDHTWGVIGSFNGWAEDAAMVVSGNTATATIEIVAEDADKKFKVRADGDWAINYGFAATEELTAAPVDGTSFPAAFNAGDIVVAEAGTYEIVLTIEGEVETFTITKK